MSEPVCAKKGAYIVNLEAGEYWWCACGKSKTQPFCDGSHKDTDFSPVKLTVTESGSQYLCGCKKTANPPYCDGTHNNLT
ncbi:MAG: CDGSH iron-sulfur domain-containing protein [Gammaproteobacteria bacterium]|jgi:CDGSH-type Zn-finger protein